MSPLLKRVLPPPPQKLEGDRFADDVVGLVVATAFVIIVAGVVFDLAAGMGLL